LGGYYYQGENKYLDIFKCTPDGSSWEVQDTIFGFGPYEILDITSDNAGNTYMLRFKGNFYINKYNLNGSCFRFRLNGIPEASKIAIDPRNNDIILACYKTESRLGYIIKYDSSFTEIGESEFPVQGDIIKLICAPSGKIFTLDDGYGITCFYSLGNIKWSYETSGIPYDMIIDNDENPVVATSISTMKFRSDSAGTIWRDNHPHYKLCAGKNNDVYALNPSGGHISVSKISRSGSFFWNYELENGNRVDSAFSISADSSSNIYIAGYSENGLNDTKGILFKLSQNFCSVSGNVTTLNGSQNIESGYVKAIQYNPTSDEITTADSANIQLNGTYLLSHCPVENVYVMAFNKFEIVPTYCDTTIDWHYAKSISPLSNPDTINLDAKQLTGPKGKFHISGSVSTQGPPPHQLKDAIVYAMVGTDFKGYCITGLNVYGNLYIDSLTPGLYMIIAVRPGYDTYVKYISIVNANYVVLISMKPIVSVTKEGNKVPGSFSLHQNYPNPFNPSTTIEFDIAKSSDVKIIIYDITGKEITELTNEHFQAGSYSVQWNASGFPSGIYFYRLITDDYIVSRRMVLVK
jgi:hypothetical protein